ncbi:hypothetical protein SRHO_G00282450 [Serrasalmus rhombeus]
MQKRSGPCFADQSELEWLKRSNAGLVSTLAHWAEQGHKEQPEGKATPYTTRAAPAPASPPLAPLLAPNYQRLSRTSRTLSICPVTS